MAVRSIVRFDAIRFHVEATGLGYQAEFLTRLIHEKQIIGRGAARVHRSGRIGIGESEEYFFGCPLASQDHASPHARLSLQIVLKIRRIRTLTDGVTIAGYARRTACPCCNAPLAAAVGTSCSSPRAEDIPFDQHSSFISGYVPHRIFFTYLRCGNCDACYCPLYYSAEQLQHLYEQPTREHGRRSARLARTYAGGLSGYSAPSQPHGGWVARDWRGYRPLRGSLRRAGQFDRLWLSEPNKEAHAQLERRFAGNNASILGVMSPAAEVPSGSISTAVMIHVLDHVPQPEAVLLDIFRTLEPGGVLMVVTHNVNSWLARLLGRRWPPFTLQHPHLFSPGAMRTLVTSCGLRSA